jgi:hypothetical protein
MIAYNAKVIKLIGRFMSKIRKKVAFEDKDEADGYFEAYMEYNKALRNWLVGFGIGGPIFILSDKGASLKVLTCGNKDSIFWSFATGVFLQILIAFINKNTNWQQYDRLTSSPIGRNWFANKWITLMIWCSDQMWIDIVFDILTMCLFLKATILVGACLLN